jgi:hypothetical protein
VQTKKNDRNQRQRFVQGLYRKKKHKNVRRNEDSKIWTMIFWISVLIAFVVLIICEVFFIDRGVPLPGFLSKLAAAFQRVF